MSKEKEYYECERCHKTFEKVDVNGLYQPQKKFLRPSAYVKLGTDAIAVLPRLCHKCFSDIKADIVKYLNKQVA